MIPVEIEWQFDAPDLEAVARWLARPRPAAGRLVPGLRLGPLRTRRIHDVYLDTADWRIFRAGYVLRLRRVGRHSESTLKGRTSKRGALAVRSERTQVLPAATVAALFAHAGPVRDVLRRIVRARDLEVRAEIRTVRRVLPLALEGESAGEVTLDDACVPAAAAPPPLRRVEVEVPRALLSRLRPFVARLRSAGALRPARRTKAGWAFAARESPPAGPHSGHHLVVRSTMPASAVARAVLRRHFDALCWNEPGARLGEDPEFVHDMRVATRRLRAALRFFADALPAGEVRRLRAGLQVLGHGLGAVRDLDVLIQQVEEWRGGRGPLSAPALEPLLAHLRRRREAAGVRLHERLDAPSTARTLAGLAALVAREPQAGPPLAAVAPGLLGRAHRRFARQAKRVRGADAAASPGAEALHVLRIRGKRLRYALEFVEPAFGPPARAVIEALVEAQDNLGLQQDGEVARELLARLVSRSPRSFPPPTRRALRALRTRYARRTQLLRRRLPVLLRRLEGRRWDTLCRVLDAAQLRVGGESPAD